MITEELKYTESHEWIQWDESAGEVTIGITDFAVEQLGDIVYLELPACGDQSKKGAPFGAIESVKAASDLYSPVSGKVIAVNEPLVDDLEMFATDAYQQAWMIKVKIDDPAELDALMSSADYTECLKTQL